MNNIISGALGAALGYSLKKYRQESDDKCPVDLQVYMEESTINVRGITYTIPEGFMAKREVRINANPISWYIVFDSLHSEYPDTPRASNGVPYAIQYTSVVLSIMDGDYAWFTRNGKWNIEWLTASGRNKFKLYLKKKNGKYRQIYPKAIGMGTYKDAWDIKVFYVDKLTENITATRDIPLLENEVDYPNSSGDIVLRPCEGPCPGSPE